MNYLFNPNTPLQASFGEPNLFYSINIKIKENDLDTMPFILGKRIVIIPESYYLA